MGGAQRQPVRSKPQTLPAETLSHRDGRAVRDGGLRAYRRVDGIQKSEAPGLADVRGVSEQEERRKPRDGRAARAWELRAYRRVPGVSRDVRGVSKQQESRRPRDGDNSLAGEMRANGIQGGEKPGASLDGRGVSDTDEIRRDRQSAEDFARLQPVNARLELRGETHVTLFEKSQRQLL